MRTQHLKYTDWNIQAGQSICGPLRVPLVACLLVCAEMAGRKDVTLHSK